MKYQKCRRRGVPKNVKQHRWHERISLGVELMQKEMMGNRQKVMMYKMRKMSPKKWKMNLQKMKL
jgi:hypothetical protein